jgi:hypothetical protein
MKTTLCSSRDSLWELGFSLLSEDMAWSGASAMLKVYVALQDGFMLLNCLLRSLKGNLYQASPPTKIIVSGIRTNGSLWTLNLELRGIC